MELLHKLNFICSVNCQHSTPRCEGFHSLLTDIIASQSYKFTIQINKDRSPVRFASAGDDVVKNLFKVCCGIMNMSLRQRGINLLDDVVLEKTLDAINFELEDNDIIVLN